MVNKKHEQFERAFVTLEELARESETNIIRDATIQRFEYTVETFWKLLKTYLQEQEGVDVHTPKSVFREAGNAGILTESEVALALEMIDDRNESVHLYNETMAEDIFREIPAYRSMMRAAGDRIKNMIQ